MNKTLTTMKIFFTMILSMVIVTQYDSMTIQINQVALGHGTTSQPHFYKNQLSNKYKVINSMKSSELAIIEDIKKGCNLLFYHQANSIKILTNFGVLRTEGNFYEDEFKPFNNNFERVFILDRTLYFDIEGSESISTEALKAEFGDFVVVGSKIPRMIEFEYKLSLPNSPDIQSFKITARYHESKISSISISQKSD
jgi:hypothetical protein